MHSMHIGILKMKTTSEISTSVIINGENPIFTLYIFISRYSKLFWWIKTELSARRSCSKLDVEMIYDIADEVTQELSESLLSRYETGLEESMKGSDFIFDFVNLFHYKCH